MHHDEIPPGTLYLLILKALARRGELHGYEIATWIEQVSDEVLQVQEGFTVPRLTEDVDQRLGHSKMGRDRRESPRALLPPHAIGPKAA